MKIVTGKNENEILAINKDDNILGKGYIYEFIASEIYEIDRVNYFIDVKAEVGDNDNKIKKFIIQNLVEKAKTKRKNYPSYKSKVYNCCFSNDEKKLVLFSSIDGFEHDEGMHILSCDLSTITPHKSSNLDYEIKEDCLNNDEEINKFINVHSKVFRSHPYTKEQIIEFKEQKGFKNIAIYDGETMIGNILLIVEDNKDTGLKIGWLEDMFISKKYRNKHLGEFLVKSGLDYFKSLGLNESRLEVWSANIRAYNLYKKMGYSFKEETESSVGMWI
ncbi:GNAT family N-acetyltransferase [Clostridiaceae bacterium M8S5]|nr:GNAT family N-acetyltransferase [Clostridiaceae bacterium M8S5]